MNPKATPSKQKQAYWKYSSWLKAHQLTKKMFYLDREEPEVSAGSLGQTHPARMGRATMLTSISSRLEAVGSQEIDSVRLLIQSMAGTMRIILQKDVGALGYAART
jgi:hypothetical protein